MVVTTLEKLLALAAEENAAWIAKIFFLLASVWGRDRVPTVSVCSQIDPKATCAKGVAKIELAFYAEAKDVKTLAHAAGV